MLDAYASKHLGNRSEAADCIIGRYTFLTQEADLSSITLDAFVMLCQLNDGIITNKVISPRAALLAGVYQKIADQEDFRDTLATKPPGFFRDDSCESRAAFVEKLNIERDQLDKIVATLKALDQTQNMALLEYVEQALSSENNVENYACCKEAYMQMQRGSAQF